MDDHAGRIESLYQDIVDRYVPGEAPNYHYRELLLHHQQQVIDRERGIERMQVDQEREIKRLRDAETERRMEMEAEVSRLVETIATLEEEREWWRKQAQRLGHEIDRMENTPLYKLYRRLTR